MVAQKPFFLLWSSWISSGSPVGFWRAFISSYMDWSNQQRGLHYAVFNPDSILLQSSAPEPSTQGFPLLSGLKRGIGICNYAIVTINTYLQLNNLVY